MKEMNLEIPSNAKVLLALSGGVDSSVALALLLERGNHCIGITMQHKPQGQEQDIADAKSICAQLGVEHHTIGIQGEYEQFLAEQIRAVYAKGLTPNPCVLCNQQMKFGLFFDKFLQTNPQAFGDTPPQDVYYASGHYARVVQLASGHYALAKAPYAQKDQSYFLYRLAQEQLARLRFPLGLMEKPHVRLLAEKYGLSVKKKPDSQDFCMHPSVLRPVKEQPTLLVDKAGKVLAAGLGLSHYTIGMRRGLGVSSNNPLYVIAIRPQRHEVVLGEEADLYRSEFYLDNLVYTPELLLASKLGVRIRSTATEIEAKVELIEEDRLKVTLAQPARAISAGQSAVFSADGIVLGGGYIMAIDSVS
jgi:tRNA-uridine 2-sulfurtransferase